MSSRLSWRCPVCGVENAPALPRCRVCRASEPSRPAPPIYDDHGLVLGPALGTTIAVVLMVAIAVTGAHFAPASHYWTASGAVPGWAGEARVNRATELLLALRQTRKLVVELDTSLTTGAPPPEHWSTDLAHVRARWSLYGDAERFPGLAGVETETGAIVQDLASLRGRISNGLGGDAARDELGRILSRLDRAEESLEHGQGVLARFRAADR